MSKKSVYQDINPDALKHFNLEKEPVYGLFAYNKINDTVVVSDEQIYFDFKNKFLENTESINIKNHKKVFVLPNCPIGLERIKEVCREKNLILTNNYEESDLIITHSNFRDEIYYRGYGDIQKINTKIMIYHIKNHIAFDNTNGNVPEVDMYDKPVIYTPSSYNDKPTYLFEDCISLFYDSFIISPLAINLAYHIETNAVPVITIDNLIFSQAETIVLTEELLDDITAMMRNDKEMAIQIIITIDFKQEIHLLWKLAHVIGRYWMPRNKDYKYWEQKANISELQQKDPEEMIFYLKEIGLLNKKNFKFFESMCRDKIEIYHRALYNFKVFIKEEFKDYI